MKDITLLQWIGIIINATFCLYCFACCFIPYPKSPIEPIEPGELEDKDDIDCPHPEGTCHYCKHRGKHE